MRFNKKRCVLLLPLCLVPTAIYYFTIENIQHAEDEIRHQKTSLLDNVFAALLKAVDFLNTDYSEINMDGLYGYRICQGSLIGTLQDCSRDNFRCPDELKDKLRSIIRRLNDIGSKALPYIEQKDEKYYNNYLPALEVPFVVKYIPEKWNVLPQQLPQTQKSYSGIKGDNCFGGIMGTYIDGGRKSPPCTIVDGCWDLMTVKGTIGYFTTHQLLYLLFGEHSGCEQKLGDLIRRDVGMSLRDWQRHLCEQIYIDATIREYNLAVDVSAEDLFLEQSALCGILGFQNFFNDTWIRMVLTWQNARGCFNAPGPAMDILAAIHKNIVEINRLEEEMSRQDGSLKKRDQGEALNRMFKLKLDNYRYSIMLRGSYDAINKARGVWTSRSLMSERVMGNDCLSHKTGLGAAVLGNYVRYLVSEIHAKK